VVETVNVRKLAVTLCAIISIASTPAYAATAKPTHAPTATKKVVAAEKSTTATKAVSPKKTTALKNGVTPKKMTSVKKLITTPKKVAVRKYVYHAPVHKAVKPSPATNWPPKGFTSVGTAYARVPSGTELVGILSAMKNSSAAINSCAMDPAKPNAPAYSCAAILVGSTERCTWWKVSSTITGVDSANSANRVTIGQITVLQPGAAAKTIQTIFLVSPIPLQTGIKFGDIHALCGIGPSTDPVPSFTFVPDPSYTPPPTPVATPSATPSPSPTN
jgi:hypothetical protein